MPDRGGEAIPGACTKERFCNPGLRSFLRDYKLLFCFHVSVTVKEAIRNLMIALYPRGVSLIVSAWTTAKTKDGVNRYLAQFARTNTQ